MVLRVNVNTRDLNKKVDSVNRKIKKGEDLAIKDMLTLGVNKAKTIAPQNMGRTVTFIQSFSKSDNPRIIARNPTKGSAHRNHPNSGRYAGNFNLVKWMHLTGGEHQTPNPYNRNTGKTGTHIRSGDPRFMYTTRRYLNSIKRRVATGSFKRVFIRQ